jgi:hypothetical protein
MKRIIILLCLPTLLYGGGPKTKKKQQKELQLIEAQIREIITFLSSDELEGRRTGTEGERKAAEFIVSKFQAIGLTKYPSLDYFLPFEIDEGRFPNEYTACSIGGVDLDGTEFAPLPFSANGKLSELILNKIQEKGSTLLVPISKVSDKKLNNPHEDAINAYHQYASTQLSYGYNGIIFYNDISAEYDYDYVKSNLSVLNKPIAFINYEASQKRLKNEMTKEWTDIYLNVDIQSSFRNGTNLAGYIDNGAAKTVIIGAHYDHLGYGEDHNSLHTDTIKAIHNGADDNASGVAAMLSLATQIKASPMKGYNYLFLAFSGEELGLYGSKKLLEQAPQIASVANYMINIDMLGRYDESKKALTIGGVGTSPTWVPMIEKSEKFFTPKWDSAGIGPSDHTSFYMKNIPVLFFFTGLHTDYHKPSDDADKINYSGESRIIKYIYNLIQSLDQNPPLQFTKTKEPKQEGARFKVTLGIMPDYTYSGAGVRADGIIDGRIAQRIGMQAGDIITQLGDTKVLDMQTYMEALSKFKQFDKTKVKILRGDKELMMDIEFK